VTQPTGIYLKIIAIMEVVERIAKRGQNKAQNYDYLMAEDVINEIRQECVKQKLVIMAGCTGVTTIEGQSKSGGTQYLTTTAMEYHIVDAETGDKVTIPWHGQGQDSGDKGIYKAFTGSVKTFLRNLFMIPTGDDPEDDGKPPKPRQQLPQRPPTQDAPPPPGPRPTPPTPPQKPTDEPAKPDDTQLVNSAQASEVYKIGSAKGWTEAHIKAILKRQKGYDSASQLTIKEYMAFVDYLRKNKPKAEREATA
jgi:hypothetical protein